jgi:hypothetical protein
MNEHAISIKLDVPWGVLKVFAKSRIVFQMFGKRIAIFPAISPSVVWDK